MSNQQTDNIPLDDDVQGIQKPPKQRSRNFYRKRPGSERQNQDLGEDEKRTSNDDDTQRSNNSEENDNRMNSSRGRGGFRRGGGFRYFRGRGRFARSLPYFSDFPRSYLPPIDRRAGRFEVRDGYPVPVGRDDDHPPEHTNDQSNRGQRGGRGHGRRRGKVNKADNMEHPTATVTTTNDNNNEEKPESADANKRRNSKRRQRRKHRKANNNGTGVEQQIDGAATDDQHHVETNDPGSARSQGKKFSRQRRRRRNMNPNQNGAEADESAKPAPVKKPQDDETVVKNVVRYMVNKVARRLAPRYRRRSHPKTKDKKESDKDVEKPQVRSAPQGRRGARTGNGYFMEHDYYDPYGMNYYYDMSYGRQGRGFYGRGRSRGGRGRGRFRQQRGAKKGHQSEATTEQEKVAEPNPTNDISQTTAAICEQVNQLSINGDANQ